LHHDGKFGPLYIFGAVSVLFYSIFHWVFEPAEG